MSLASVYAVAQASAAAGVVNANEQAPTPFVGANGRAEVTTTGNLRLVPSGSSIMEIPPQGALLFRDWLTTTFGD